VTGFKVDAAVILQQ